MSPEIILQRLGDFSLQYEKYARRPWQLYNPYVEGDAILLAFETFDGLLQFVEANCEP